MSSRLGNVLRGGSSAFGLTLLLTGLGSGTAFGQSTFDPYNAAIGNYQNFVTPIMPPNLALPGQARASVELSEQALYGSRVGSTPFERYLRDGCKDAPSESSSALDYGVSNRSLGAG